MQWTRFEPDIFRWVAKHMPEAGVSTAVVALSRALEASLFPRSVVALGLAQHRSFTSVAEAQMRMR